MGSMGQRGLANPGDGAGRALPPECPPPLRQHISVGPWPLTAMAEGQGLQASGSKSGAQLLGLGRPAHQKQTRRTREAYDFPLLTGSHGVMRAP